MIKLCNFLAIALAFAIGSAIPTISLAQSTPSAGKIYKKLSAPTSKTLRSRPKVSASEVKQNRQLRRQLPSISIQTINFEFGSAHIPRSQRWKVGNIASAIKRFTRRRPGELFLLEGHTDAVGSDRSNLALSRQRARSLKRQLVQYFGVRPYVLEAEGYGEFDLLVPTQYAEWRNRRVTIRRISDVVYRQ